MKILIVDDDPKMLMLLEETSTSLGHEPTTCTSATQALQLHDNNFYPLILLDWMLPEMDGLKFCKTIREAPEGDIPVIIMITERDRTKDLEQVLEAGADDYIAKASINFGTLNVRLKIAEKKVFERAKRKVAEASLAEVHMQLEKRHDDMRSVFNELRLGVMIVEQDNEISFLNSTAKDLFGLSYNHTSRNTWNSLLPVTREVRDQIWNMKRRPPERRSKLIFQMHNRKDKKYWLELEIKSDPRAPEKNFFLFYDVSDVHNLRNQLNKQAQFHGLIGKSEPMLLLRRQIEDFAKLTWTVLIEGETGSGKELIARAIHLASDRKDKPFVAVNTAGLNDSLLTSQLFGHKRGAFTGAVEDQIGLFESAEGGTLFLDEIGDISPHVQVSLLRVLEERTIVRLGESKERKINVRFVTATNRDLRKEVSEGNFRSDLLYRIRVARINVPPLRERREDISLLTEHFLSQSRAATGKNIDDISNDAMQCMVEYSWHGNIRELKSAIDYAMIHCMGASIQASDLPPEILEARTADAKEAEQALAGIGDIEGAIQAAGGNRAKAARLLGVSRTTLYRRLAEKTPK